MFLVEEQILYGIGTSMSILLISPNTSYGMSEDVTLRSLQPLGIAYVGATLENAGFDVDLLDCSYLRLSPERAAERVKGSSYDIVGISVVKPTFNWAIKASKLLKKRHNVFVVLGGHAATLQHSYIMKRYAYVDAVVRGEGEQTALELVSRLHNGESLDGLLGLTFREGSNICVNAPRPLIEDLDVLLYPARHKLPSLREYHKDLPKLQASILSSRGCPYNCAFCSVSIFYGMSPGKKYRARAPSKVVDEIESLVKMGATNLVFVDDCFIIDRRAEEISRQLVERSIDINIKITTRVDQIVRNSKFLPSLRAAGFNSVELGIESFCQRFLDKYNKGTTLSQNEEAIKIVRQHDMDLAVDFIMFDPETTMEDLKQNLYYIRKNNLHYHGNIFFTALLLFSPGQPIFDAMQQKGEVTEVEENEYGWRFADRFVEKLHNLMLFYNVSYSSRVVDLTSKIRTMLIERLTQKDMHDILVGDRKTVADGIPPRSYERLEFFYKALQREVFDWFAQCLQEIERVRAGELEEKHLKENLAELFRETDRKHRKIERAIRKL